MLDLCGVVLVFRTVEGLEKAPVSVILLKVYLFQLELTFKLKLGELFRGRLLGANEMKSTLYCRDT